jgi:RNA polymerase sigma factor (sigma-70 family)
MIQREHSLLQHIQTIFESGTIGELSDRQLLERFTSSDRETAELCFSALIKRHGPMVFRTSQAILRDPHDAEDAFQATFLVLARKARSLWIRDSLGPWLFQVACRVAACARSAAHRRRGHERKTAGTRASMVEHRTWDDCGAVVCDELNRLPDRYRTAVVLCDLEGMTQERAAQVLGWPAGTLRSRLARGRQRLRDRLTRRGLAPSVAPALSSLSAEMPTATVPDPLAEITAHAAVQAALGRAAIGTTASVGSLMEGALRGMFWNKVKLMAAGTLAGGLFAGTAALAYWSSGLERGQAPAPKADAPANDAAAAKPSPGAPVSAGLQSLSPNAKARLDVANKLRRWTYERSRIDPSQDFTTEFLRCQNRYYDVAQEVLVKTDADRVRFLEHRLAIVKRTEKYIKDLQKGSGTSPGEALAAELDRLEIEDRLEKAKARLEAVGVASSAAVSSELAQFLNQDTWAPGQSNFRAPPSSTN